ncbi:MAG: hypothetical protein ABJB55_10215 [Actinomycetota bacterium]
MKIVKAIALVSIGALVTLGINAAIAGPNGGSATGKGVTQVKTKYGEILVGTFSGWTDVTTMSITVPAGTKAIIDVRFDAYGYCNGDVSTAGSCRLRILVGGKVAKPVTANWIALQDASNGNSEEGQWMIERSTPILGPGTYKIKIQHAAIGDPSTYFGIQAWHAIAERIAA